ncbi:MAG: HAMP domain-containing histidine kinase [Anaerolineales bacterium]|nr:HAMP domain-containing histidine kinase [Anaerolineales bacterium]
MKNNHNAAFHQAKKNLLLTLVSGGIVAAVLFYWLLGPAYGIGTAVGVLLSLVIIALSPTPSLHNPQQQQQIDQLQTSLTQRESQLAQLKRELQQAQEMVKKGEETAVLDRTARNRFWRHVSHELRTPLNGVINFSHMIGLGFYGDVTPKQNNYLSRIEQSGWFLLTMLNDLSDLAKIESDEFQISLTPTDLQSVCEESLATLNSVITDDDVRIIRDYPDTWPQLTADERRLKQALSNLLRNAAKQIEEGYIALRVQPEPAWLQLIIEDTGEGMTPQQQAALFPDIGIKQPPLMVQEEKPNFGLAVAAKIIEMHGGSIQLKSEKGRGTILTIRIPTGST